MSRCCVRRGWSACAVLLAVLLAGVAQSQQLPDKPETLPPPRPSAGSGAKTLPDVGSAGSNLILVGSRHFLNAAMSRTTDRHDPVTDSFEGTESVGESHSQSQTGVEALPSEDRGVLNLVTLGVIHTRTTGRSSQLPITLQNQGTITFETRKPVFIEESGVTWLPAQTCAHARTELLCVETDIPHKLVDQLLKQFAAQGFYKAKARAEKHQVEKAEQNINQRADEESDVQLAKLDQNLKERLASFRESGLTWSALTFMTTPLAMRVAFVIDDGVAAGARTTAPEAPWPADLSARVHQAVVNRAAKNRYAGKTLKEDELIKDLGGYFGRTESAKPEKKDADKDVKDAKDDKDEPPKNGEKPTFEITFDDNEPITMECANQIVVLVLNTKVFAQLDEEGAKTAKFTDIKITVRYRVEMSTTGPVLVRQAPVDAKGPGAGNLAAAVAIRRQLSRRVFPEKLPVQPLTLTGNLARVGKLRATYAHADDGWLTMGWER